MSLQISKRVDAISLGTIKGAMVGKAGPLELELACQFRFQQPSIIVNKQCQLSIGIVGASVACGWKQLLPLLLIGQRHH